MYAKGNLLTWNKIFVRVYVVSISAPCLLHLQNFLHNSLHHLIIILQGEYKICWNGSMYMIWYVQKKQTKIFQTHLLSGWDIGCRGIGHGAWGGCSSHAWGCLGVTIPCHIMDFTCKDSKIFGQVLTQPSMNNYEVINFINNSKSLAMTASQQQLNQITWQSLHYD